MELKLFRELRAEIDEDASKVAVAGDPDGGDVNDSPLVKVLTKRLKHVRNFTKHPVAGDHQFNGSREAVGIGEDIDSKMFEVDGTKIDETPFSGKSKVLDKMTFPTKGVKDMGKSKGKSKKGRKVGKYGHLESFLVRGESLIEDVFSTLKKIKKPNQQEEVKFKNGKSEAVDRQTALALIKVHDSLNPPQRKKFVENLNKGPSQFLKMVDFAFSTG